MGNVSLMPMRIWLGGRPTEVAGIASVATRKEHRRQGVAKRLMRHVLAIVDEWKMPAVLFTDLPNVYEGLGFHSIEQTSIDHDVSAGQCHRIDHRIFLDMELIIECL